MTYPYYQNLQKIINKIYDNVADFRQLRAVESQPCQFIRQIQESGSVPVLEVRRQVVVHEIVVALVEREESVVEVSGRAVTLGFLPLPDCTRKISLNITNFP